MNNNGVTVHSYVHGKLSYPDADDFTDDVDGGLTLYTTDGEGNTVAIAVYASGQWTYASFNPEVTDEEE